MSRLKDLQTPCQWLREGERLSREWLRDAWDLLFGPQPELVLRDLLVRRRLGLALGWLALYGLARNALDAGYLLVPALEGPGLAGRCLNAAFFVAWVGLWMGLAALLARGGPSAGWRGLLIVWSATYLPLALAWGLSELWMVLVRGFEVSGIVAFLQGGLGLFNFFLYARWLWLTLEALAAVRPPALRPQVRWQWVGLGLFSLLAGMGWRLGVGQTLRLDNDLQRQLGRADAPRTMTVDRLTLRLRAPRPGELIAFETLDTEVYPDAKGRWAQAIWRLGMAGYGGSRSVGRVVRQEPGEWVVVRSVAEPPTAERLRVPRERVIGKVVRIQ